MNDRGEGRLAPGHVPAVARGAAARAEAPGSRTMEAERSQQELPALSAAELSFFRREGYLIKPAVLLPELCAQVRDRLWQENQTRKLQRNDPQSWVAPFPEDDQSRDGDNFFRNRRWQVRSLGGEPVLMDLLPNRCAHIAEQLLGHGGFIDPRTVVSTVPVSDRTGPGQRCRGIYCTLPEPPGTERVPAALQINFENDLEPVHFDSTVEDDSQTHERFKITGLIDDTPPGAAGFMLWPHTHTRLYELALQIRAEGLDPAGEKALARRQALVDAIKVDTEPVECYGPAGTIVLWHRCTAHRVAQNYSSTIRQAVLYDFVAAGAAAATVENEDPVGSGGSPSEGVGMWELWAEPPASTAPRL